MVQLSMDGPNVNWKFYDLMQKQIEKDTNSSMLNIGSCGLHIVHDAFKHGVDASGWTVDEFLKSVYWLLKDTPARRADYARAVNDDNYTIPLRFCKTRWTENVPVVQRIVKMLPQLRQYIAAVDAKSVPNPKTKSYDTVKDSCNDPLIEAKLAFYEFIGMHIQSFLTVYQTDQPMIPFLASDLFQMAKGLMEVIIKPDIMKSVTTTQKLISVDPTNTDNHKIYKKIDVGFTAEKILKKSLCDKKLTECREMEFRMEAKAFVVEILKRLLNKCPLQYTLVRNLAFLDPRHIPKKEDCINKLKRVLHIMSEAKRVEDKDCDEILKQYGQFVDDEVQTDISQFQNFNPIQQRVDTFLHDMSKNEAYSKIWTIAKQLLLLSHGQATVERGFSVNRQIEVENRDEDSYIAQRIVCDHLNAVGGLMQVKIDRDMLAAASGARMKYQAYLDNQKKQKKVEEESRKGKAEDAEIEDLKVKRKRLQCDMDALIKSADEFALKAEDRGDIAMIAKSNSTRNSAKDKLSKINVIDAQINPRTTRGGGWVPPPPPLAFFPYYFFDDSNWKNCFSVSVTRDRRHILAYVTSS